MTGNTHVTDDAGVAVVMPALDELPNLKVLIPEVFASLSQMSRGPRAVYVVVEDHPTVELIQEIRALGAQPVRRTPTNSFGDALRTGIAAVAEEYEYVIIMDADGSHRPDTIPRLLERAKDANVVVASRYTRGGTTANGPVLKAMSRILNLGYRVVLGLKCNDVSTNFKLYRREDLQSITLECQAFDIVEEILFRIRKLHTDAFVIVEIPDHFATRNYGTTKRRLGPFIVAYFVTLVRLRLSKSR